MSYRALLQHKEASLIASVCCTPMGTEASEGNGTQTE